MGDGLFRVSLSREATGIKQIHTCVCDTTRVVNSINPFLILSSKPSLFTEYSRQAVNQVSQLRKSATS